MFCRVFTSQNWAWKAPAFLDMRNLLSTEKPLSNSLWNSNPSDCDCTVMPSTNEELVISRVTGSTLVNELL